MLQDDERVQQTSEAPPSKPIEIRLSDDYRRAKRNHLFASSVVIVLSFAAGDAINVPGLPNNEIVAGLALGLTWLAALFFAEEYRTEYSLARVRNSEVNSNLTAAEIEGVFNERLAAVKEGTRLLSDLTVVAQEQRDKIKEEVDETLHLIDKFRLSIFDFDASLKADNTKKIRINIGELKELANATAKTLYHTHWKAERILLADANHLSTYIQKFELLYYFDMNLHAAFHRTSTSIFQQQRWSFRRDRIISIFLFICATMGTIWHLVSRFFYP